MAAVCLITVIQMTVAATSAVEEAFLSRLDRSKIYNSKSLVENLQSAVGVPNSYKIGCSQGQELGRLRNSKELHQG